MGRKKAVKTTNDDTLDKNLNKVKITIKCKNQHQKDFLKLLKDQNNEICFGVGSAGSGKSYISLAYALSALYDNTTPYNKIIIIVPTCEAGNMSIGFLKGTLEEKIYPYIEADTYTMGKILDNSNNENSSKIIEELVNSKTIEYRVVNFVRGFNFDNCLLMISEAENYSKEEMLLLLTRIGENCKMIVTGDPKQMDRKDLKRSGNDCGMVYAMNKLKELEQIGCVEFNDKDIVRNPLIQKIFDMWD